MNRARFALAGALLAFTVGGRAAFATGPDFLDHRPLPRRDYPRGKPVHAHTREIARKARQKAKREARANGV